MDIGCVIKMKPKQVVPDQVRGYKLKTESANYGANQTILYALGIGASKDPLDKDDLNFTYENAENFKVLPSFGVTLGSINSLFEALMMCPGMPEFNPMKLLHGEHKLELFKPFPTSQNVSIEGEIVDVADKVKGALVTIACNILDQDRNLLCRNTYKLFIRGIGGFGDKGTLNDSLPKIPERAPDFQFTDSTQPNQAILYRLAGDTNPLHISPEMAAMGGFDKPILHGLCFYGYACRAVLKKFCNDDVNLLKSLAVRFTSHVFPGETLVTEMWKEGNKVVFQQKTQERGKPCAIGFAELNPAPKL